MMGSAWLLLALCAAFVFDAGVDSANPDVKLRITKKDLDQANRRSLSALSGAFRAMSLPSFSRKSGNPKYYVRNLHVTRFKLPTSRISHLGGGGIRWTLRNAGLTLRGNFRVYGKVWIIPYSVSGIVAADASRVSMTVVLRKGKRARCHARVGSINVEVKKTGLFNGVYNFFIRQFQGKFKRNLQKTICQTVERVANKILPSLSGRAAEGMPLPLTSDIHHINDRLAPMEKALAIATDPNYRP